MAHTQPFICFFSYKSKTHFIEAHCMSKISELFFITFSLYSSEVSMHKGETVLETEYYLIWQNIYYVTRAKYVWILNQVRCWYSSIAGIHQQFLLVREYITVVLKVSFTMAGYLCCPYAADWQFAAGCQAPANTMLVWCKRNITWQQPCQLNTVNSASSLLTLRLITMHIYGSGPMFHPHYNQIYTQPTRCTAQQQNNYTNFVTNITAAILPHYIWSGIHFQLCIDGLN